MTTTPNNTIALPNATFTASDAALLKYTVSPDVMLEAAAAKRADIDEQLRYEAVVFFETALQTAVERIGESIESAAIEGRGSTTVMPLSYFKTALSDTDAYSLTKRVFVDNTFTMGDYITRNICDHYRPFETYFSGMGANRLETLQKSREIFPLWLADKLAAIFRKAGYKVDNQATIERKCNTKYVALVCDYLVISW